MMFWAPLSSEKKIPAEDSKERLKRLQKARVRHIHMASLSKRANLTKAKWIRIVTKDSRKEIVFKLLK
jgi:hypothetical protein